MTELHIFALNVASETRHTHLTRARGESPALPPLSAWLGVSALDTDAIELFPVADLEGMTLSDYIAAAFAPDAIPPGDRARLDALEGSVLLVPDAALPSAPAPRAELTRIADLALSEADHAADLPKAALTPAPGEAAPAASVPPPAKKPRRATALRLLIVFAILIGLYILMEA